MWLINIMREGYKLPPNKFTLSRHPDSRSIPPLSKRDLYDQFNLATPAIPR